MSLFFFCPIVYILPLVLKTLAVPVLKHDSENWSLNRSDKRKIEAAEMRFLTIMAGYTLWDKKRSSDIREQLGIFNINDKLTQYKINWREHIQRMDDNRLLKKKTLNCKPEGIINIGRPLTRWEDDFREEGRNRLRGLSPLMMMFLSNSIF